MPRKHEPIMTHQSWDWSIPDDIRAEAFEIAYAQGTNTSWKIDNIARQLMEAKA